MSTSDEHDHPLVEFAAQIIHVARTHKNGDRSIPCLIGYPGGFTYCDGPRVVDYTVAQAFVSAGWTPPGAS